MLISIYD